ncbi:MAG: ATP-binding cassette domain-containing protein [Planctomycetota bacterium]
MKPMLEVRGLSKVFRTALPGWRRRFKEFVAVDSADLDIAAGETLGIVGESGSGKTTLARCILRALQPTAGQVIFRDGDAEHRLDQIDDTRLIPLRRRMQMIFQDPYSSLNPRMTVQELITEPLLVHRVCGKAERRDRAAAMLERVGLPTSALLRYPHAFSGGQRQRIGIARALILSPALVVADESVSALDVTVQAQVLDLLAELQAEMGLTYLFVSHDLSVVRQVCDRLIVMHRGRIVEAGRAEDIFREPRHPYTRVLLSAVPNPDPDRKLTPLRVEDLSDDALRPLPDVVERATLTGASA